MAQFPQHCYKSLAIMNIMNISWRGWSPVKYFGSKKNRTFDYDELKLRQQAASKLRHCVLKYVNKPF